MRRESFGSLMHIKTSGIVLLSGGGLLILVAFSAVMSLLGDPQTPPPPVKTVTLRNSSNTAPPVRKSPAPSSPIAKAAEPPAPGSSWPPETTPDDANPIVWNHEGWDKSIKDIVDGPLVEEWSSVIQVPKGWSWGIQLIVPGTLVHIKTNNYEVVQDQKGRWFGLDGGPANYPFNRLTTEYFQYRAANKSSLGRRHVVFLVKDF